MLRMWFSVPSTWCDMANELEYVIKRIAELRIEVEDLIDYLDLIEARLWNSGKKSYKVHEVKKILRIK